MFDELRGLDRLTDKDTGMYMDEIWKSGKAMECKESTGAYGKDDIEKIIDRLALYEAHVPALLAKLDAMERAQKDGRVVVLPCKPTVELMRALMVAIGSMKFNMGIYDADMQSYEYMLCGLRDAIGEALSPTDAQKGVR
jgi:hypothetical protein